MLPLLFLFLAPITTLGERPLFRVPSEPAWWEDFEGSPTAGPPSGIIHYPEESRLANVKQLTFGGANAEAYFSFDDQRISFQATNWGTECDQIFQFNLDDGAMQEDNPPQMVSTGLGKTTCSFFYPDGQRILYASTHKSGGPKCPKAPCDKPTDTFVAELCRNGSYIWPVEPEYDIFVTNRSAKNGKVIDQLTSVMGYDAEGVVSPLGDRIAFTSLRSGDLELWTMNLDGSDKQQITDTLGYDGGSFFSPDGQKLVWRASRPQTPEEQDHYKKLLEHNLVSPLEMELFVGSANGSGDPFQVTSLGNSNWAPYYHPDGERIIFSSNFNSSGGFNFNLYLIPETGDESRLERVTFDPVFDSFPMFSHSTDEPTRLIFASARNSTKMGEINLFLADWVEGGDPTRTPRPPKTTPGPRPHTTPKGASATIASFISTLAMMAVAVVLTIL